MGLIAEEKDDFWDSFIIVLSVISKQESIFIGSDMHYHVGRDADAYGGVHGGMGFRTRNAEGVRILEFGDAVGMVVCNTFFKKEESKLITYQSGDNRSMIDYLMADKIVKVVPKPRVWKLKDGETARLFTREMAVRKNDVTKADDVQKTWLLMKET